MENVYQQLKGNTHTTDSYRMSFYRSIDTLDDTGFMTDEKKAEWFSEITKLFTDVNHTSPFLMACAFVAREKASTTTLSLKQIFLSFASVYVKDANVSSINHIVLDMFRCYRSLDVLGNIS